MNKAFIFLIVLFALPLQAQTFEKVSNDYKIQLPKDHGSHRQFQTEWWYFTGHLVTGDKEIYKDSTDYGFQLTFFRRANKSEQSKSEWDESYLAHAAITDVNGKSYLFEERLSSGGLGIAGSSDADLDVWNKNWRAERVGEKIYLSFSLKNKCKLRLVSQQSPKTILHGENGISHKSNCEGCASVYYSLAPIMFDGHIDCNNKRENVSGISWMDHEFMTNALSSSQVGWDWVSLMFDDKSELMLFQIRNNKGQTDFANGTYIKDGVKTILTKDDFEIIPTSFWQSEKAKYPTSWKIKIKKFNLDLKVSSLIEDQEFKSKDGPVYWEGAVKTDGGLGYFEMTGYDKAIEFKP